MGIGQGDKDARFLKVDKSNKSVWVSADGISPNVTERYDLNTVLARIRWGATVSKMFIYKIFPFFSNQISIYSPMQNSPHYSGG